MTEELNKTIAQASLDNLHDILLPDAIGFFPLAPGWVIVLALLVSLVLSFAYAWVLHYQRAQYRRDAIKEALGYSEANITNALALLALSKRVAISAYGRKRVASLSLEVWWDFMEQHALLQWDEGLKTVIQSLLYSRGTTISQKEFEAIKSTVLLWIKTHKDANHD